jgi:D-alanyl-lipoteichoic acid acyltransferase DltB (MBOAT superfamily)
MLVNSIVFWAFFLIVLIPYFSILRKSSRWQNLWVLAASYFFYGYADWRMVPLLLGATVVFYLLGIYIEEGGTLGAARAKDADINLAESRQKSTKLRRKEEGDYSPNINSKALMVVGVVLGAGLLLYFKYMNFFIEQFATLFGLMGLHTNWSTFNIIVPIGISFFTFKLIAYVVEVYKGNMEPCRDFVTFAAYIAFFPTIMSGPIDSPKMFIPQLEKPRWWNNEMVLEGLKRVLWGMFLKMCIADKISPYTDSVFNNYYHHSGITIILASVLYTFQIYTDFCGYSEMAIGVSQVMGIKVTENFLRPYFVTNVGDFWRRWHMSLMNWFRDYIYIPLGGSRCSKARMYWNTMVVFMVSGLWHGANWTFIIWGAYHGALVCLYKAIRSLTPRSALPLRLAKNPSPKGEGNSGKILSKYLAVLFVFVLVTIGWMVFRCDTFQQFFGMLGRFTAPGGLFFSWALTAVLPIGIMLFKELKDEEGWNIHLLHSKNLYVQAVSIALLIVYIFYTGELNGAQFIYFQF